MPKRVSLKGRGTDIFFGGEAQDEKTPAVPLPPESPASETIDDANRNASTTASVLASSSADEPSLDGPTVHTTAIAGKAERTTQSIRRTAATRRSQSETPPDDLQQMLTSELVFYRQELIEQIRRTVKVPGREVSYIRLTPEEKAQLAKVVYGFRSRGRKTTENEINRIAVNFMLLDYQANGEDSLLTKVIEALLA